MAFPGEFLSLKEKTQNTEKGKSLFREKAGTHDT